MDMFTCDQIKEAVYILVEPTLYSGQPYETVHHVTCNNKPCARLDFVQSGFFAFFNIFFRLLLKSLAIEVTPTVVVTRSRTRAFALNIVQADTHTLIYHIFPVRRERRCQASNNWMR